MYLPQREQRFTGPIPGITILFYEKRLTHRVRLRKEFGMYSPLFRKVQTVLIKKIHNILEEFDRPDLRRRVVLINADHGLKMRSRLFTTKK